MSHPKMKINKLSISNFRGIRTGTLQGFSSINILLGPNGSGKSTILEAIYLLRYNIDDSINGCLPEDWIAQKRDGKTLDNSWWYKNDTKQAITINVGIEGSIRLSMQSLGENVQVRRFETEYGGDVSTPASQEIIKQREKIFFLDSSITSRRVEEILWDHITDIRLDKDIVTRINNIFGLNIENLTKAKGGKIVKVLFPDFGIDINSLGAGMRTIFRLLALCVAQRPSIILMEEIDAFQHPDSLLRTAGTLIDISMMDGTQFFLSTHSEETYRIFLEAAKKRGSDAVRVFTLNLKSDGTLESKWSGQEGALSLSNAGRDLRKT
jgi:AAA15 family ATPase/GTPase